MKKTFLLLLLAIHFFTPSSAQKVNVTSISRERDTHNFYTMMREAFPLAYNDPAAPRFIFFDDNKNFIFGVGGYVQATAVYDFNGVENYNSFTTSNIALKNQQPGSSLGFTVDQSRLFFKLIGDTDVGKIVAYIEMDFRGQQGSPLLRQAFVQFKGLTIGQTWSTFCDMAAVPPTIDLEGPSSAIEIRQPMLRYTRSFEKKWEVSIAAELAKTSYTPGDYTSTIRQKIPDIPLVIKYTGNRGGHLQAGAILKNISYHDEINDKDRIQSGWGTMLSGKLNLWKSGNFLFQGVYGKGITNYIQDITGLGYDLIPDTEKKGYLKTPAMWGTFGSLVQNWTSKLHSTLVCSYVRIESRSNLPATTYKYTQYAGINLLWNFSEYGTTGLEYLFGRRNDFNHEYGNASRINAMVRYTF